MGIQQKEVIVPKHVDVRDRNNSVLGWMDYNIYLRKYNTTKLIGQTKPSFVIPVYLLKRKLLEDFPRAVGKVSPMKPFRVLNLNFIAQYTVKWVELVDKADNDYITVEVRLTEL